ncbi:MAG: hypothetical protein RLZZ360_394 [Candidatus Parcubacteria bacterium]|jgi:hypothetical protein
MQRMLSAVMAFFLLVPMPAQAEKSVWQGPHLSYGVPIQTGSHDFTLSHKDWGEYVVWTLPLSGQGAVGELGYRWQLGNSALTTALTARCIGAWSGSLPREKCTSTSQSAISSDVCPYRLEGP